MNPLTQTIEEISRASLDVLEALGITEVEMEVSLPELDHLAELALGGEVERVDTSDPAGGFGSVDLWAQTVVPAVEKVMDLRRNRALSLPKLDEIIAEMVLRVGSPRARTGREDFRRAMCSALNIALTTLSPDGSRELHEELS